MLISSDVKWSKEKDGKVPKKAIEGGKTGSGEVLYIGRANHEKSVTVGKVINLYFALLNELYRIHFILN